MDAPNNSRDKKSAQSEWIYSELRTGVAPTTYGGESIERRMRSCRGCQGRYSCQCIRVVIVVNVFVVVAETNGGGWETAVPYYGCMGMFIAVVVHQGSGLQHGHTTASVYALAWVWQDVIVLFLWLGEPFSSLSTFSSFSAIATAVLAIARCGPSGLRPP